ncbi:ExbD/TolR family protein [Marinimicrobium alkaliphilum]|uniref:ExbD/TolR family protein n=1 Tax=Marinimicrobium alkaliphilum TaxID=2202654 RepID=UPI000DBA9027|nr:biopolymer transporter ExbD [Marinimicrobium alkaliphilum]
MSRRKKGRKAEEGNDIDLTPMLDVVFIMLIFFIVTASFVREMGLDVNVPEDSDQPPPEDAERNIMVRITSDNQIWMDDRRVDEQAVRSNIERLRAEFPQAAVIIQAESAANARTYVSVADAARAAQAPNIVLVPVGGPQ